jgi:hypothetical protein
VPKYNCGISTLEKLQDFYNIPPQGKIGENVQKPSRTREKSNMRSTTPEGVVNSKPRVETRG